MNNIDIHFFLNNTNNTVDQHFYGKKTIFFKNDY